VTDAQLLAILERNEWTYSAGICSSCHGLKPCVQWERWPSDSLRRGKRRYFPNQLGHAPECERALLMRDLGGTPCMRSAPPQEQPR
jgi:hypothetical protein